jgi:hypothetical protein
MTFTKQLLGAVSIVAFVLGGCATTAANSGGGNVEQTAQAGDPAEKFDVTKLTCWDISTLPEADAGYAAVLLYGYNAGQTGNREHSGNSIEGAITKAMETCAANPNMMALQAFK